MTKPSAAAWDYALDRLETAGKRERWRRDPVAWVQERLGEEVWSRQADIMRAVADNRLTAVQSCHGIGKALDVDTPLPTPSGWTTMGKVQPGDQLLDEQGNPCNVVAVSPEWNDRPCYAVRVDDGDTIVADAAHEWVTMRQSTRERLRRTVQDWRDHQDTAQVVDTATMFASHKVNTCQSSNYTLPLTRALQLPHREDLPVPPYVLGAWLGDGSKSSAVMTTCDQWMIDEFERQGMLTSVLPRKTVRDRAVDFGFQPAHGLLWQPACQGKGRAVLRAAGVLNDKHIPMSYRRASVDQRLELLRGIMDTDGFCQMNGNVAIEQRDKAIAYGVVELARSLGWRAHMTRQDRPHPNRPGDTYYFWHVNFRPDVAPFKLPRKVATFSERLRWDKRFTHRTVDHMERVENRTTRCVEVDSPSHLFLAGRGMVPTHNSHIASRLIAWYIDVHEPGQVFAVTTAPTTAQVRAILWRYVRQVQVKASLPGEVMQTAEWKINGELVAMGRKPNSYDGAAYQGIHAPLGVMCVIDEASGVDEALWVASDSLVTTPESRILAVGNPDIPGSHFHRVCTTEAGWKRFKVSAFQTPAFTGEPVSKELARALVSRDWVEDKALRWGEDNPLYQAKVCAEFADSDDGLIPYSWVRAAHARWHEWADRGSPEVGGRRIIGVDVARYGTDDTAIAIREGDVIREVRRWSRMDTTQTTSLVEAELMFPQAHAVVDVIGVGAGVVDQLRAHGQRVEAFNAAERTNRRDSSNSWKFTNKRSASWWNLRELLDPSKSATLALPDDDELTNDLITPQWRIGTGNTLIVESKDSMRTRLGRSTDTGDAVAMALWHNPSTGRQDPDDDRPRRPRVHAYDTGGSTFGDQFTGLGGGWS